MNKKSLGIALMCLFYFAACDSSIHGNSTPKKEEERSVVNELPEKEEKYRPPDGGFGALDESRDVRKEAEEQQKESRDALQDTQ